MGSCVFQQLQVFNVYKQKTSLESIKIQSGYVPHAASSTLSSWVYQFYLARLDRESILP